MLSEISGDGVEWEAELKYSSSHWSVSLYIMKGNLSVESGFVVLSPTSFPFCSSAKRKNYPCPSRHHLSPNGNHPMGMKLTPEADPRLFMKREIPVPYLNHLSSNGRDY